MSIRISKMVYESPAFNLPVLQRTWTLDELESWLSTAINITAIECLKHNRGNIFMALSGGLDSSFCLAVIRHNFGNVPIFTFTVGANQEHPDVQYAEKVSQAFKTTHQSIFADKDIISIVAYMKENHDDLFWGETGRIAGAGPLLLLHAVKLHAATLVPKLDDAPRVIVHDGVDELLGGYWEHRKHKTLQKQEAAFKNLWGQLYDKHLYPLDKKAGYYNVVPLFPYLQPIVVKYISRIPVQERTSHDESKIPLRRLAEKYLPPEIVGDIIQRPKIGFCDALKEF